MRIHQFLSVVIVSSVLLSSVVQGDDPPATEYGLEVGKLMPFHVADFVNGKSKGHGGCPSVMIANSRGRGLIIWSRGKVDSAFQLAKALNEAASVDDKFHRFLVAFDMDAKSLNEQAEGGLDNIVIGKARQSAKVELDGRNVDAKTVVLVFFLDKKDIKTKWSFAADELSEAKIKEIVAAAKEFAAGQK